MIIQVDASMLPTAAKIHSESWIESHRSFCDEQFLSKHSAEAQLHYLRSEMESGKCLFMLVDKTPKGIVSVRDDLIENLYVLPTEQRNGYGTELLLFAMARCKGTPCLWILENNEAAYRLYTQHGFKPTGNKHKLSDTISEIELKKFEGID